VLKLAGLSSCSVRTELNRECGLAISRLISAVTGTFCVFDVMSSANSSPRREAASPPHQDVAMRKSRYRRYLAVDIVFLQLQRQSKLGLKRAGFHSLAGGMRVAIFSGSSVCTLPTSLEELPLTLREETDDSDDRYSDPGQGWALKPLSQKTAAKPLGACYTDRWMISATAWIPATASPRCQQASHCGW
jgi:hypothetical protein